MRSCFAFKSVCALCLAAALQLPAVAAAQAPPSLDVTRREPVPEAHVPGIALELNPLWQFFPGGITELRLLVPVLAADSWDYRGELVLGTYSDFASRVVRNDEDGKVRNLSAKLGFRQYVVAGLHVEASANLGWRNETERPDGNGYDAFHARLWLLAGYQHELSQQFYVNTRAGFGIHLYRSDRFADEERDLVPGADMNVGVRF